MRTGWLPPKVPDGSDPADRRKFTGSAPDPRPSWATFREALSVVTFRPHLRKTIRVALVVGTVIFAINQLDVVLSGDADTSTIVKAALTYLVPFGVSNYGILLASHDPGRRDNR